MEQRDILPAGSGGIRLTRADIRARLEGRAVTLRGNGSAERDNVRAAVLVPLVERADGWSVVLTLRSADLADHAGQISLPKRKRRSASTAIMSRPPAGSTPGSPAPGSK
jgi:hypothetical protein